MGLLDVTENRLSRLKSDTEKEQHITRLLEKGLELAANNKGMYGGGSDYDDMRTAFLRADSPENFLTILEKDFGMTPRELAHEYPLWEKTVTEWMRNEKNAARLQELFDSKAKKEMKREVGGLLRDLEPPELSAGKK